MGRLTINLNVNIHFFYLTHYHTILTLTPLEKRAFVNIVFKGENTGNQDFLLFLQCFLFF